MLKTSQNYEIPEERSPYENPLTPPLVGIVISDLRPKSVSKGITTVSLSKRIQMANKTQTLRKPIFSPINMISSDNPKQTPYVPSPHNNPLSKRMSCQQQSVEKLLKRPSEPISAVAQNTPLDPTDRQHYNNILSIMREQMNRSLGLLQKKSEAEANSLAETLMKLNERLREVEGQLTERTAQLARLKDNISIGQGSNRGVANNLDIDKCAQYINGRVRDLDTKIKMIIRQQSLSGNQAARSGGCLSRVQQKVDRLSEDFLRARVGEVNCLTTRVFKFLESWDKFLQGLQTSTQQISKRCQFPTSMINYDDRINQLRLDQESTRTSLESYASKQFKYNSLEVDNLRSQLNTMKVLVTKLQSDRFPKITTHGSSFKVPNQAKVDCTSISKLPQQPKHYLMSSKLSFNQTSTASLQDIHSGKISTPNNNQSDDQRDHFFYPEQDSSYQRFTDEQQQLIQQQTTQAVVQLTEIIRRKKMKLPVKCLVDQGYLKFAETNTYVFDVKGSLLDVTTCDIGTAVSRRLIIL